MAKPATDPVCFIRKDGQLQRIDINQLVYLETARNYVHLCSATEKLAVRAKLQDALALLPKEKFVKVHRLFAVSVTEIETIAKDHLVLKSITTPIPIGKPYYPEILKRITILG